MELNKDYNIRLLVITRMMPWKRTEIAENNLVWFIFIYSDSWAAVTFSNCFDIWKRYIAMKEYITRLTKLTQNGAVDVEQHWFGACDILPDSMWFHEIWVWKWWRHQMETLSALLVICVCGVGWGVGVWWGGVGWGWVIHRSPVNSPHKGQWHGALIFIFFDLHLNKRLSNQW